MAATVLGRASAADGRQAKAAAGWLTVPVVCPRHGEFSLRATDPATADAACVGIQPGVARARVDRALLFRLATSERFEQGVRAVAFAEARAWAAARRYVAGTEEADALRLARELTGRGVGASLDFFGEQVRDPQLAQAATNRYVALAHQLADLPDDVWLSIDLSHVGLDVDVSFCRSQLERIVAALPAGRLIQIGAEDAGRTDDTLDVVLPLARAGAPLGATLPANLRRSDRDLARLADAQLHVRLVKGAYVEASKVARPYGEETNLAYVRLAHELTEAGLRVALATHDRVLREALLRALPEAEIEMLLGIRSQDGEQLAAHGRTVRLYVPFGEDWFRYWMRRLAESRGN